MKKLLQMTSLFSFVMAYSQQDDLPTVREYLKKQKEKKEFPFLRRYESGSTITDWSPLGKLSHTSGSGNNVYLLRTDNMPCVAPALDQFNMPCLVPEMRQNTMPVIRPRLTVIIE